MYPRLKGLGMVVVPARRELDGAAAEVGQRRQIRCRSGRSSFRCPIPVRSGRSDLPRECNRQYSPALLRIEEHGGIGVAKNVPGVRIGAHAIADTNHCGRREAIGGAHSRQELADSRVDTVIPRNAAVSAEHDVAGVQIENAKTFVVVAISERVVLPANAQRQRQLGSDLPAVLQVPRPHGPAQCIGIEERSGFAGAAGQAEQEIGPGVEPGRGRPEAGGDVAIELERAARLLEGAALRLEVIDLRSGSTRCRRGRRACPCSSSGSRRLPTAGRGTGKDWRAVHCPALRQRG